MTEWTAVRSSNIAGISYNPGTKILSVKFTKGTIYHYQDVPEELIDEMLEAASVGKFFHQQILRGNFEFEKEISDEPK